VSTWPYYRRTLGERTVSFEFDADQASAFAGDLYAAEEQCADYFERLNLLAMHLSFDADYLRRKRKGAA
jgi:hypothetical protein